MPFNRVTFILPLVVVVDVVVELVGASVISAVDFLVVVLVVATILVVVVMAANVVGGLVVICVVIVMVGVRISVAVLLLDFAGLVVNVVVT